jgi:L-aminopeptidase/D-esterase-like protein
MARYPGSLTDVPGLAVGHADDPVGLTGCTVILCGEGSTAGGLVRGFAPGTRETALLQPGMLVEQVHAVLLTGGSAFGLAAADGVMRYLEEQGIGYGMGTIRVPIVPGAVLFDLAVGNAAARPDASMGYAAAQAATTAETRQGNVGAGMGASVGKLLGMEHAMKGGLGMASLRRGELMVGALVAVNAIGNIHDPEEGTLLAGTRRRDGTGFHEVLADQEGVTEPATGNTVIGVIATNARLDVAAANRLAAAGHDGLARAIRPAHTLYDGDTLFGLATGEQPYDDILLMEMAARAVAYAVANAVTTAISLGGLPGAGDTG